MDEDTFRSFSHWQLADVKIMICCDCWRTIPVVKYLSLQGMMESFLPQLLHTPRTHTDKNKLQKKKMWPLIMSPTWVNGIIILVIIMKGNVMLGPESVTLSCVGKESGFGLVSAVRFSCHWNDFHGRKTNSGRTDLISIMYFALFILGQL